MTKHDYDKVVKGLEHCITRFDGCHEDCPYHDTNLCPTGLMFDALALIKEQREALREWGRNSLYAPRKEKKDVGI